MTSPTLLRAHRADLLALSRAAVNDLRRLWKQVDGADMARDLLLETLPDLVEDYYLMSGSLGADWYDETRERSGVGGRYRAKPARPPDRGRAEALARWGVEPLYRANPDPNAALTLVSGGLHRTVLDGDRNTVRDAALRDRWADGWQRVGDGDNCAFCDMLIARGSVYEDETVDFASHDHCNCYAAPAFRGQPRPVKPYQPTNRRISDADRARVREYLRTH